MRPDWCDEETFQRAWALLSEIQMKDAGDVGGWNAEASLERIARALIQAKAGGMEACAKLAEGFVGQTDFDLEPEAAVSESVTAKSIAAAIRSRIPRGE